MIFEEIKNIESGKKELKTFGLALGLASLIWIGLFSWHKKSWYPYSFLLPGTLILSAYVYPFILKLPHKVLRVLFILINWILTRLILCIVFYLVITPTKIISRLFGKRFLDLKFNKSIDSYWILRENSHSDRKACQKQF